MQLRDVRRQNVQVLVDRLSAQRLSLSRIRSVVSAIRALYGYAIERGYVEFSPADSLLLPPEGDPADPCGLGRLELVGRGRRGACGRASVVGPDNGADPRGGWRR